MRKILGCIVALIFGALTAFGQGGQYSKAVAYPNVAALSSVPCTTGQGPFAFVYALDSTAGLYQGTGSPCVWAKVGGGVSTNPSPPTLNGIAFGNATGILQITAPGGAGTLCLTETNGGTPVFGSCAGSAATAWPAVTAGTNSGAGSLLVGTGSSFGPSGTGTITSTNVQASVGFAPTVDGVIGVNTNTHALVVGSNGSTIVEGAAATGTGTGTTCSNQFLTAISAIAAPTCSTATLASAQFANQGTTSTVLHGNAAGNPSFGAVNLATDVSGTLSAAQFPALTGPVTTTAGSLVTTIANSGVTAGSYTSTNLTVGADGRITSAANGSGGGLPTGATIGQSLLYTSSSAGTPDWFIHNPVGTLVQQNGALSGNGFEAWDDGTLFAASGTSGSLDAVTAAFPKGANVLVHETNCIVPVVGTADDPFQNSNLVNLTVELAGCSDTGGVNASGTINTSGTAFSSASPASFTSAMVGGTVEISGVMYKIATVSSGSAGTLTVSAGSQTGVPYSTKGNYIFNHTIHLTSSEGLRCASNMGAPRDPKGCGIKAGKAIAEKVITDPSTPLTVAVGTSCSGTPSFAANGTFSIGWDAYNASGHTRDQSSNRTTFTISNHSTQCVTFTSPALPTNATGETLYIATNSTAEPLMYQIPVARGGTVAGFMPGSTAIEVDGPVPSGTNPAPDANDTQTAIHIGTGTPGSSLDAELGTIFIGPKVEGIALDANGLQMGISLLSDQEHSGAIHADVVNANGGQCSICVFGFQGYVNTTSSQLLEDSVSGSGCSATAICNGAGQSITTAVWTNTAISCINCTTMHAWEGLDISQTEVSTSPPAGYHSFDFSGPSNGRSASTCVLGASNLHTETTNSVTGSSVNVTNCNVGIRDSDFFLPGNSSTPTIVFNSGALNLANVSSCAASVCASGVPLDDVTATGKTEQYSAGQTITDYSSDGLGHWQSPDVGSNWPAGLIATQPIVAPTVTTSQGQYVIGANPTSSTPVASSYEKIGLAPRGITGNPGTDTLLFTDNNNVVTANVTGALTENVPNPTALVNSGYFTIYRNRSASATVTLTPTGSPLWTIYGQVTWSVSPGQTCTLSVNPNASTDWAADCTESALTAGTNVTFTRTATGLSIAAAGGSGSPCTVTAGSLQYNNAGAFGCVTPFTFSGSTISSAAAGILDLSAATGTAAFKVPVGAGNTVTAAGAIDFDSTNKDYHAYINGVDSKFAAYPTSLTPTASQCADWVAAGSAWTLGSIACSGGGGISGSGTSGQVMVWNGTTSATGYTGLTSDSSGNFTANSSSTLGNPVYTATAEGCVADSGTTDNGPCINTMTTAISTSGGTIFFPVSGTNIYQVATAPTAISNNNVVVQCAPGVILQAKTDLTLFNLTGTNDALRGCILDGNSISSAGTHPLVTVSGTNDLLDGNTVQNTNSAGNGHAGWLTVTGGSGNQVRRNNIVSTVDIGILTNNASGGTSTGTVVEANYCTTGTLLSNQYCIGTTQGLSGTFSNNTVQCKGGSGSCFSANNIGNIKQTSWTSNHAIASGTGLNFLFKLFGDIGGSITGNTANDNGNSVLYGIAVGDLNQTAVTGNAVTSTGAATGFCYNDVDSVYTTFVSNACSMTNANATAGLLADTSGTAFSYNTIANNSFSFPSNFSGIGIKLQQTSTLANNGNIISGNTLQNAGTINGTAIQITAANGADLNNTLVVGNNISTFTTGINVAAGTGTTIGLNLITGTTTPVSDSGTNSRIVTHEVIGSVALVSGTPSVGTVTLSGNDAFVTGHYTCMIADQTASLTATAFVTLTSGTSFTITGPAANTDTWAYDCRGY